MLTPKVQYDLTNAKTYFAEHLSVGDYYTEGQRVGGLWFGEGARSLGLTGQVTENAFLRVCDNQKPFADELITQRLKTTRKEVSGDGKVQELANRRVFYDFTISPPKSVSILALIGQDHRIIAAHDRATAKAMKELERFAGTRVRMGGRSEDRLTGNVVGAAFRHDTSRALDPHLHTHCIIFNATFDPVECRWKALQNREMYMARKFIENVYYHEIARDLRRFGYEIENTARGDFEIKGITSELCERFSKRHEEINEKTRLLLEHHPEKAEGNVAEIRANIARYERSRKIKDIPLEELRRDWNSQLTPHEKRMFAKTGNSRTEAPLPEPIFAIAEEALDWAESHLFERKSVIQEHELWQVALERMRGENLSLADLRSATEGAEYLRNADDPRRLTTAEVLERERDIVKQAKGGINEFDPLASGTALEESPLNEEQRKAAEIILASRDFITLFRGGAGTGKSFTLREVERNLRNAGRAVHILAPQRQQVEDLTKDGFMNPKTVSEFLIRPEIYPGDVVIVDEAGQLGASQMQKLLRAIQAQRGRILLSGDTRQHGAVEASDALRAIEKYSGLQAAELKEIRRQDPAKARSEAEHISIKEYKQAVEAAAEGDIAASFSRLEANGAILECPPGEQQQWLAAHYLEHASHQRSALVVSQTWTEIHRVNDAIRIALKNAGLLGRQERAVQALEAIDLTDAQKRDQRFYGEESVIVLNRNACGFKKGEMVKLLAFTERGLIVESKNKVKPIANRFLSHITVCRQKEMALSSGDRLQLRANARAKDGRRLSNGELVTVESVKRNGEIVLQDGRVIPREYRQFGRGYAVTSYASQGKTVDYVLFSDSAIRAATNSKQWYVSISRGRRGIQIFTTDKEMLRESVGQPGERTLAMDIELPKPPLLSQQKGVRI